MEHEQVREDKDVRTFVGGCEIIISGAEFKQKSQVHRVFPLIPVVLYLGGEAACEEGMMFYFECTFRVSFIIL